MQRNEKSTIIEVGPHYYGDSEHNFPESAEKFFAEGVLFEQSTGLFTLLKLDGKFVEGHVPFPALDYLYISSVLLCLHLLLCVAVFLGTCLFSYTILEHLQGKISACSTFYFLLCSASAIVTHRISHFILRTVLWHGRCG